ncbi:MAG: AMP-dependent synthetase [Acidobacteria bacterium RIFCSPLOWO2_02_FULL_64_15]|nr:MAG: AMP-dependent synthetase [Acidobacteria bacterium RIFCSPLOWO2_02_FULL_64_15]
MVVDFMHRAWEGDPNALAVVFGKTSCSYGRLLDRYRSLGTYLKTSGITPGKVVGLKGDFTPGAIALLLALIDNRSIVVPFTTASQKSDEIKAHVAQLEGMLEVERETDEVDYFPLDGHADHPYYARVRDAGTPGLVLFTSGTSGEPKGAVHDFSKLLEKFKTRRPALRTLNFLLFDHWGGLNTLFHTLSNAGQVLATGDRSPDGVCALIEQHRVELLPTSPTFLNLLLLSEAYTRHDLSSIRVITYGTEPMPLNTLRRVKELFPEAKLQQTYGLIELGVLRSRSKSDDSLWVEVGGDGYQTRVVDGILQIKAESAMLGYLNAASPFTEDGYFVTGDMVEVEGSHIKIIGRKSEIINVGGEKVYPQEVEDAILSFDNVADVIVHAERNLITGNIVCAKVRLKHPEDAKAFSTRLKTFLRPRLRPYQMPIKIHVGDSIALSDRFKKMRANEETPGA